MRKTCSESATAVADIIIEIFRRLLQLAIFFGSSWQKRCTKWHLSKSVTLEPKLGTVLLEWTMLILLQDKFHKVLESIIRYSNLHCHKFHTYHLPLHEVLNGNYFNAGVNFESLQFISSRIIMFAFETFCLLMILLFMIVKSIWGTCITCLLKILTGFGKSIINDSGEWTSGVTSLARTSLKDR
jgi:hypothetical protein